MTLPLLQGGDRLLAIAMVDLKCSSAAFGLSAIISDGGLHEVNNANRAACVNVQLSLTISAKIVALF